MLRTLSLILAALLIATGATLILDNPEPCSTDTDCGCALDCLESK